MAWDVQRECVIVILMVVMVVMVVCDVASPLPAAVPRVVL